MTAQVVPPPPPPPLASMRHPQKQPHPSLIALAPLLQPLPPRSPSSPMALLPLLPRSTAAGTAAAATAPWHSTRLPGAAARVTARAITNSTSDWSRRGVRAAAHWERQRTRPSGTCCVSLAAGRPAASPPPRLPWRPSLHSRGSFLWQRRRQQQRTPPPAPPPAAPPRRPRILLRHSASTHRRYHSRPRLVGWEGPGG